MFSPKNTNFLDLPVSWPLPSDEETGGQDFLGEYAQSSEAPQLYSTEKWVGVSRSTPSSTEADFLSDSTQPRRSSSQVEPSQPIQEQTVKYQPANDFTLDINGSILHSSQPLEDQPTFSAVHNEPTNSQVPFLLSGPLPPDSPDLESTLPLSTGPGPSSSADTSSWRWTMAPSATTQGKIQGRTVIMNDTGSELKDATGLVLQRGGVNIETGESKDNDWQVSNTSDTLSLGGNTDTAPTPCKTSNQSWAPTDPDDFTSTESVHPSAALSFALFVPLYSDWNSALAAWGLAWEAHIYGLGSVFSVFGFISVLCLFGLPLRCPPGSLFFTLLHLFLLAFAGTQAFCLIYDAYSYQDRLPPLASLLLSVLPFPCLIAAFSLAFLLLSLRSRMHISLPLAISTSFSILPKPCLLLCMSVVHFGVSLSCAGMLQLFPSLPTMILLFPQGLFVCLTVFLSCSYLIFYCLIRVDNKHIYRLNDNGESGGSPEVVRPPSCPFAKAEDWGRAARAGVGASLCLLASGGLQLYGILHSLGLGGVDGFGFQPWPWWGFQVGCRLSEIGVCLGLSLIGTHPLFCHSNSSIKTMIHPRPGSWSRLSCSSPSRGLTLPSQGDLGSSGLSSHDSWSQDKQEKLVVCDVITKGKSDTLPLCSMVDSPGNGLDCVPKSNHTRTAALPLPTPPSPPQRPKNIAESHMSSVNHLGLADSTVDLRPPSPIDLSRSIDQALFSESLFSHSIFGWPRLFHASSSLSLSSPGQGTSKQESSPVENALYRTSSCGHMDEDNTLAGSRPSQPCSSFTSHNKQPMSPEQSDWKGSVLGSTQGLCSKARETTGKLRSHSWANRGQNFTHSSLPRAIPHLSYYRRYRTLSLASQDSQGSSRLAGTKHLSESKQLEWDLAVQAEFVNVCRQIDALSVCSDTIEL